MAPQGEEGVEDTSDEAVSCQAVIIPCLPIWLCDGYANYMTMIKCWIAIGFVMDSLRKMSDILLFRIYHYILLFITNINIF